MCKRVIDLNEFRTNSQLAVLHVGFNQIFDIKPIRTTTVINITELRIQNNNLTDISELFKLARLEVLELSRNRRLDFSTVMFSCWSELTHLFLIDTNPKILDHDYRMLTGCIKLEYLNLMDNNLSLLCFERFPVLPQLTKFNIRNNSLFSLDVLKLKAKSQNLNKITTTGNNWSCDYHEHNLTIEMERSNITEISNNAPANEKVCSSNSVNPQIVENEKSNKGSQIKGKILCGLSFWVYIGVMFVMQISALNFGILVTRLFACEIHKKRTKFCITLSA
jgi:Leucine-rich repeat (LRR) protein